MSGCDSVFAGLFSVSIIVLLGSVYRIGGYRGFIVVFDPVVEKLDSCWRSLYQVRVFSAGQWRRIWSLGKAKHAESIQLTDIGWSWLKNPMVCLTYKCSSGWHSAQICIVLESYIRRKRLMQWLPQWVATPRTDAPSMNRTGHRLSTSYQSSTWRRHLAILPSIELRVDKDMAYLDRLENLSVDEIRRQKACNEKYDSFDKENVITVWTRI